jgi:hypothetical protein
VLCSHRRNRDVPDDDFPSGDGEDDGDWRLGSFLARNGFEHHPVSCVHCPELANPQPDDLLSRERATAPLKQTTLFESVVVVSTQQFARGVVWKTLVVKLVWPAMHFTFSRRSGS